MNKKGLRDSIYLFWSIIFSPIYLPHLIFGRLKNWEKIKSDVKTNSRHINLKLNNFFSLLYLLHTNSYYRTLFYYRIGAMLSLLISWYRPGNKYFNISYSTRIGKSMLLFHPYATIINAESIGDNFSCLQLTTIGASYKGRPTIGDNVAIAANVTIVGDVKIGDNTEIGAGSVVVKDIPSNSLAVGNPARVVKEDYTRHA